MINRGKFKIEQVVYLYGDGGGARAGRVANRLKILNNGHTVTARAQLYAIVTASLLPRRRRCRITIATAPVVVCVIQFFRTQM